MRFYKILGLLAFLTVATAASCPIAAKSIHSYTAENGVLVYFNVPQKHTDIDGIPVALPEPVSPALAKSLTKAPENSASSRYESAISKHSAAYGVDANLVRAVITAESGYNPVAVSNKGACGLMQLIPSTARRFGVKNIFHPDQNIEGGVKYLRFLLDTFNNDLKLVLAAYNAGENVVKRIGGIPNYRETIGYVNRIVARYGEVYRPGQTAALQGNSPAGAAVAAEQPPVVSKVYKIIDPAGNVMYTNRPTTD